VDTNISEKHAASIFKVAVCRVWYQLGYKANKNGEKESGSLLGHNIPFPKKKFFFLYMYFNPEGGNMVLQNYDIHL
jgi:hypothetical protein